MDIIPSLAVATERLLDSDDFLNDCYASGTHWGDGDTDIVAFNRFFRPDIVSVTAAHHETARPSTPAPSAPADSPGPVASTIPLHLAAPTASATFDHQSPQKPHPIWKEPRSAVRALSADMFTSFVGNSTVSQRCPVEHQIPQRQTVSSLAPDLRRNSSNRARQNIYPIDSPESQPTPDLRNTSAKRAHVPSHVSQHSWYPPPHSFSLSLLAGGTSSLNVPLEFADPHLSCDTSGRPARISSHNEKVLPVLYAEQKSTAQAQATLGFRENIVQQHAAADNLQAPLSDLGDQSVEDTDNAEPERKNRGLSSGDAKYSSKGLRKPAKKLKKKRKPAQFKNPKPSNHCHICTHKKQVHETRVCMCLREGLCRKVFCKQCIEKEGLSLDNGLDAKGEWLCFHCRNDCPERAQCHTYNKINNNIRDCRIRKKGARQPRKRSNQSISNTTSSQSLSPKVCSPSLLEGQSEDAAHAERREYVKHAERNKSNFSDLDGIIHLCYSAAGRMEAHDETEEEMSVFSAHE